MGAIEGVGFGEGLSPTGVWGCAPEKFFFEIWQQILAKYSTFFYQLRVLKKSSSL